MLPKPSAGYSSAVDDLGLGDMLGMQVSGETDDLRKKRMREMQERAMMGPGGSPATLSLFGAGRPGAY